MICLNCGNSAYSKHSKKFCSRSCSVAYNNSLRKVKKTNCLQCGKECGRNNRKFCSQKCVKEHQYQIAKESFYGLTFVGSTHNRLLKRILLDDRGHVCEICKNDKWNDQPIPLELEHVDGNANNNKPDNVKLLCPNCHALTPTFKAKNKGNGRLWRRKNSDNLRCK